MTVDGNLSRSSQRSAKLFLSDDKDLNLWIPRGNTH